MKSSSTLSNRIFTIGFSIALVAQLSLAGCTGVPTRQSTEAPISRIEADVQSGELAFPEPLQTVRPMYPWELKRAGITGLVNVNCLIDESGRLQEVEVANATDDKFIKPALDAFAKWTFKPAVRAGVPVAMRVTVPIRFALEQ